MQFTLGEAARHCGIAKETISKAIRFGKLSATRREDGSWSIDNAELAQYLDVEMEAQHRAELAEQRLADLQTMLDDMAAQRDAWQHQAQATQRLLAEATARRPWWKRLAG
jgi:predicted site-specific integrase-resolvase